MAQDILVDEQINPGLELLRLVDPVLPIKVAFWMKLPDGAQADLYIASDAIHAGNHLWAYGQVNPLANHVGGYGIDSTDVRVIDGDDPRATAALALRVEERGRRVRALGRHPLGDTYPEDLYIYPPLSLLTDAR